MARMDRIKEELGWLKVAFALFFVADVSLVAWLAQNYQTAPAVLSSLCSVGIAVFTAAVASINRAALRRFRELEDL